MNLTEKQKALVMANVTIVRDCTSTGEKFVDRVRRLVEKHKPDLVWIDPLLAFIGGDLSSQETASAFLRNMLNPLSLSAGFAWMLIHHTPKPVREGNGYQGADKAYSGFGSSELTNWARSVLTLAPCGDDADGKRIYRLEVTKRGKRSNLNSTGIIAQNAVQPHANLRHSDVGLAWIVADEPERKTAGRPEIVVNFEDYKHIVAKGISAGDLQSCIRNKSKVGHTKSRDLTAAWESEGLIKNTGTEKHKKYVLNEDQK
jgi:hypothetical protein